MDELLVIFDNEMKYAIHNVNWNKKFEISFSLNEIVCMYCMYGN